MTRDGRASMVDIVKMMEFNIECQQDKENCYAKWNEEYKHLVYVYGSFSELDSSD